MATLNLQCSRFLLRYLQKGKFRAHSFQRYHAPAAAALDANSQVFNLQDARQEAQNKRQTSIIATSSLPEYSEEFLDEMYSALQAPEPTNPPEQPLPAPTADEHLALLGSRLCEGDRKPSYIQLLQTMEERIAQASADGPISVPISIATKGEWVALLESALAAQDELSVVRSLDMVLKSCHPALEDVFELILKSCGRAANPRLAIDILNLYQQSGRVPSASMHSGVIAAYVRSNDIIAAQKHLRKMEDIALMPLQRSYRMVIIALLQSSRKDAWDLFAHMRLVSYPQPDAPTYNLMISACASAPIAAPERAVDLFIEMQENGLSPTVNTYAGLIKACSRCVINGKTPFFFQAINYFREMLAAGFQPSRAILHALLQGCKSSGDLARARHLFFRMLAADPASDSSINDQTTALLFDTYKSYKIPNPNKRAELNTLTEEEVEAETAMMPLSTPNPSTEDDQTPLPPTDTLESPSQLPQSPAAVLDQISGLMARILVAHGKDISRTFPNEQFELTDLQRSVYSGIKLTPRLINAFYAAHIAYAGFRRNIEVGRALPLATGIEIDGAYYESLMGACVQSKSKRRFVDSAEEAKLIFEEWQEWASGRPLKETGAQVVWLGLIHVLARASLEDEALEQLKFFHQYLPPSLLIDDAKQKVARAKAAPAPAISLSSEAYPETWVDSWRPPRVPRKATVMLFKRFKEAERLRELTETNNIVKEYEQAEKEAAAIINRRSN